MDEKLISLVQEAYENVPFYRKYQKKAGNITDISTLPVLNKQDVVLDGKSILTFEGTAKLYRNELIHARTSGSTGDYLDIYWKKEDYNHSMLPLWWYRYKYYGISPLDKLCFFYSVSPNGDEEDIIIKNQIGFSKANLTENRIEEIYCRMMDFSPKWLLLQPSIAMLLCQYKEKYCPPDIGSIRYIELSGEMLYEGERNRIQKNFNCFIANQYGANEFNSIAYECPKGILHIMAQNVFVENEGEELLITTKTNTIMPLIRYRIGDFGNVDSNFRCECGNCSPVLKLTKGRTNDWIYCLNGDRINAYVLISAMDKTNYALDGCVLQFQLIQEDYNLFTVKLVLEESDFLEEVQEVFEENIAERRLAAAVYQYLVCDRIPLGSNKLACFINKMV